MRVDNTILEKVIRRAPFALQAFDIVTGAVINRGLRLTARPFEKRWPVYKADRAPVSGNLGFYNLPGLREYQHGEAPIESFCPEGADPNYIILIEDEQNRFLPVTNALCLPYGVTNDQGERVPAVYQTTLFSSPTRLLPIHSYGLIRGEIWDRSNNRPAAWAKVEGLIDSNPNSVQDSFAITDARGMFSLFIGYPKVSAEAAGSLNEKTWAVKLSVKYDPEALQWHKNAPQGAPPDIKSIWGQETTALIEPGELVMLLELTYGEPAIFRTAPIGGANMDGRAWINPA